MSDSPQASRKGHKPAPSLAQPKEPEHPGYKLKLMLQFGLVFGICLLGQALSVFLPIAIPGSVISMVILFILLASKLVKVDHIRQKATFLLQNMAFFFVPAGVGILANYDSIKHAVLPLLAVIVITSVLTFAAAAFTVMAVLALQRKYKRGTIKRLLKKRRVAKVRSHA